MTERIITMKRNFKTTLDKKTQEVTVTAKLELISGGVGSLDSINTTEVITYLEEVEKFKVTQNVKIDTAVNNRAGFNEGVWIFKVALPKSLEKKVKPAEKKVKPAEKKKEKKVVNHQVAADLKHFHNSEIVDEVLNAVEDE